MGRRYLLISTELFPQIFGPGEKHYRVVSGDIPPSARLADFQFRSRGPGLSPDILLTFESPDWKGTEMLDTRLESLYPSEGTFVPFAEAIKG